MSVENNTTDSELLLRSKNGDSSATEEIISRYRPTVEAIAAKYNSSPLETDDLIQEGLIGLLAAINSYNDEKGTKFSTYASICINNSVHTALSRFSRLKDIPQCSIMPLDEELFKDYPSISAEEEYLAKESVSSLTDFLYEGLSRFENEVLRLYILGFSYNDIAEKLNKNPKAIDNAIQRIRKKLEGVTF